MRVVDYLFLGCAPEVRSPYRLVTIYDRCADASAAVAGYSRPDPRQV